MVKALVFLAEGFEEIEAITVVDVLRRAEIEVTTAALGAQKVVGAHAIAIEADCTLQQIIDQRASGKGDAGHFAVMILPGGMPGSRHLRDDVRVRQLVAEQARSGHRVAAICAAPIALDAAGVLSGRRATSYPGYALPTAQFVEERVVIDQNITTSRGPGTALEFALALVEQLVSVDRATQLRQGMLVAS